MKFLLIASAFLAVAAAAPSRVTNGEDAAVGQFPYQISFMLSFYENMGYSHVCGGAIISPTWVLTAGHCILENFYARVKAGITLLSDDVNDADAQVRNVIRAIVHPDYKGDVAPNDIALLQVDAPFVFNDLVQKINLPNAGVIPTGTAVLSGWGSISTTAYDENPNHLQYAYLPLITYDECVDALEDINTGLSDPLSAEVNVCTGPIGSNLAACRGDSGGPLAQGNTIVGVVSWGLFPCGNGGPSVYSTVGAFIDFIKQHVDDL